jgi:uncharacterized protein YrrD
MIMKVTELIGKAVITDPAGENIGTVEDVLLRPEEQGLGALVVRSPHFAGPRILLAEDISSIGGDAVAIQSADRLHNQARFGTSAQLVSFGGASGRKVAKVSGAYVGELSDVRFDPATRKITGYETTGGLFARMIGRIYTFEASADTRLGKDLLVVAEEAVPIPAYSGFREL